MRDEGREWNGDRASSDFVGSDGIQLGLGYDFHLTFVQPDEVSKIHDFYLIHCR